MVLKIWQSCFKISPDYYLCPVFFFSYTIKYIKYYHDTVVSVSDPELGPVLKALMVLSPDLVLKALSPDPVLKALSPDPVLE